MLNEQGFDLWADGYDRDVGLSEEADDYPFAGYRAVLGGVYAEVLLRGGGRVLDLGCGTAVLTARLYAAGCDVTAVDFSQNMLDIARRKMPGARLLRCGIDEAPERLAGERFDAILSTYALHHFADAEKRALFARLRRLLRPGGVLCVGDVAFETRAQQDACRAKAGDEWDGDEFYFAAEDWRDVPGFAVRFDKKSHCAGVLTLTRGVE